MTRCYFAVIIHKINNMKSNLSKFIQDFGTAELCLQYLYDTKWQDGYQCRKCGHLKAIAGKKWHYKRCGKCRYDESATANTIFHKLKFPIDAAFQIVYLMVTMKKGLSSYEIARQFGVHQETAWYFRRRVQKAIQSVKEKKLQTHVEADETLIGGFEAGNPGRKKGKKRNVEIAVEIEYPEDGEKPVVRRAKAVVIDDSSGKCLEDALQNMVDHEAVITTDGWRGYTTAVKQWFHNVDLSKKGSNFKQLHFYIFNLKNWMRGTHHKVSGEHLQSYLDEYNFRFNRRNFVFQNPLVVLKAMALCPVIQYSELCAL
jgi:hypothetical protein